RQFVVDAAPLAVGAAVREAPVAVDERPPEAVALARQVAVLAERLEVLGDAWCERVGGIAVVMEVELDLTETSADQLRELIEVVRLVLLAGEEPAVAGRAAVAVAELAEGRIALRPNIYARFRDVIRRIGVMRLVVIAEREQQV